MNIKPDSDELARWLAQAEGTGSGLDREALLEAIINAMLADIEKLPRLVAFLLSIVLPLSKLVAKILAAKHLLSKPKP